ncbi:MAG: hypothetical protein ACI4D8_08295 [Wujia sp.]
MSFQSINEIEHFCFDDCVLTGFEVTGSQINLELEALIVRSNNSQNTNFTESYAGTTTVRLIGGRLISGVKDGLKYYNADGKLLSEIPDEKLSQKRLMDLPSEAVGAYLYSMEKDKEENGLFYYTLGIEFVDELDNTMSDSYRLMVSFEKAVFSWEHYMNRVQN